MQGEQLEEYLFVAQAAVLRIDESQVFNLRYGLSNEEPHTLAEIGLVCNLSRERIRQILVKSLRKIRGRGQRDIKQGETQCPCAALLLYLRGIVRPDEPGHIDRLVAFIENDLSYLPTSTHALPLVTFFVYATKDMAKSCQEQARQRIRQVRKNRLMEYKQRCRLEHLLAFVIWPSWISTVTGSQAAKVSRQRNVSADSDGFSGSFRSQKMDRDIQYESIIEYTFLLRLEELPEVVFYQEQPFVVPYQHRGRLCSYYPDVFFVLENGQGIVVEIKPVFQMALHRNLVKWSALRQFCEKEGFGLLVTDGRHAIQEVQRQHINPDFAAAMRTALLRESLSWQEYQEIKDRFGVSRAEFVALVLNEGFVWELGPFSLSRRPTPYVHTK